MVSAYRREKLGLAGSCQHARSGQEQEHARNVLDAELPGAVTGTIFDRGSD